MIKELYKVFDDNQVEDITVLDFRNTSPFYDYFLIGSVNSFRKGKAVLNYLEDKGYELGLSTNSKNESEESGWLLLDMGEVVVHIFVGEARFKYNLEGLWKDLITSEI